MSSGYLYTGLPVPCCVYFENMCKSTIGTDRFLPLGALNLNLGYCPSFGHSSSQNIYHQGGHFYFEDLR